MDDQHQQEQGTSISDIFFIKDRINNDDINLTYLPTNKMRADLMTKPLQGHLFQDHSDFILGQL
jgi:hypothetical protein